MRANAARTRNDTMHATGRHTPASPAPRRHGAGRVTAMVAGAHAGVPSFACPGPADGSASRGLAPGLSCLLAAGLGVIAAALPGDPARIACAALVCAWLMFTMHVAAASLRSLLRLPTDGDDALFDDHASLFARAHGVSRGGGNTGATGDGFPPEAHGADPAPGFSVPSVHRSAGGSTLPLHLQPGKTAHGSSHGVNGRRHPSNPRRPHPPPDRGTLPPPAAPVRPFFCPRAAAPTRRPHDRHDHGARRLALARRTA